MMKRLVIYGSFNILKTQHALEAELNTWIFIASYPFLWKLILQDTISTSTIKEKYNELPIKMCHLIPT